MAFPSHAIFLDNSGIPHAVIELDDRSINL
jgi:hypothetical protein